MTSPAPASASMVSAPHARGLYRSLLATAVVAALFCAVVSVTMLLQYSLTHTDAPLKSPQLTGLKDQLVSTPKNEALKQRIRELDLRVRRTYFEDLAFNRAGGWLLLGGLVVLVLAGKQAVTLRQELPQPQARLDGPETLARWASRSRWAVAGVGLLAGGVLVGLVMSSHTVLPRRPTEMQNLLAKLSGEDSEDPASLPSPTEFAANWPRFLGPTGNAFVTNAAIPASVNPASSTGVRWKVPVPAAGFGSPIVWSNRVFLAGGDARKREVFCFDTATGALVWQRPVQNVPGSPAKQPDIPEGTGFAASTMATDGRRVYAIFGNGDLASFRLDGGPAWAKNIGVPDNPYGHAQSLLTWQGKLIVPLDQGEAEKGRSRLFLLDGANGKVIWEKPRPVPNSWATPILVEAAGKTQIITLGGTWVISYAVRDGAELWRVECLAGEITPSPICVGGQVVAVSPSEKVLAIRPDGQGNVTKTHVAWSYEENAPDITSPVSNGEFVFAVSSPGVVTCLTVKDGKKQWDHDLEFEVNASPAIAAERLCVVGKKGVVVIMKAAPQFQEFGRFDLGEQVLASPAFAGSRMFLRTMKSLFCFGTGEEKLASQK